MVAIRRTKAKEEFGPDPSLDLPQGAHLKITSSKLFAPRFHEETGDLWGLRSPSSKRLLMTAPKMAMLTAWSSSTASI
jgi:hypothetical protein